MQVSNRAFVSIASNAVRAGLSFTTGMILARGLGPDEYGVFAFLLSSFTALRGLLDMGTSQAFFTFISKVKKPGKFISTYALWVFLQFIISFGFIYLIAPDSWINEIWLGESRSIVTIAFVAVFCQLILWETISYIGESERQTLTVQLLAILVALIYFSIVLVMFLLETLSIQYVFFAMILGYLTSIILGKKLLKINFSQDSEAISTKELIKKYWEYIKPLILYAWLGVALPFFDTWLLQKFGGSVEQAYYSVGYQIAAITYLLANAVLPIYWKEVSEAQENHKYERVEYLNHKATRVLFFLASALACFLLPWTDLIIKIILGSEYIEGSLVLMIMLFYPIHQSINQINNSSYYALEMTRPYVAIGTIVSLLSIAASFFVLAPSDYFIPGLDMGSKGLAIKMVILQMSGYNFSMWYLYKVNGWTYRPFFQLSLLVYIVLSLMIHNGLLLILGESTSEFLIFLPNVLIYSTIVFLLMRYMPIITGLSDKEVFNYVGRLYNLRGDNAI